MAQIKQPSGGLTGGSSLWLAPNYGKQITAMNG
jgi:hypothetical protein